jgi:hypothetical protein
LDELNGFGSDTSDRNIDFIINRIRRKIGDSARAPAYIGTQYGEGYVWIAERLHTGAQVPGAFLVVGPLTGISHIGPLAENARAFCEALRTLLDIKTAKDQRVVVDESCPPPEAFFGEKPKFSLELSFLDVGRRLDCALTLKAYATGQIITVSRRTVFNEKIAPGLIDQAAVEAVANDVTSVIWDLLACRAGAPSAPTDEPLPVRMHNAALMLANTASWQEGQRRLRATLHDNPDDHRAKLMLATALHSKYLLAFMILPHQDFRARDEDEMEELVLSSLPHLQDNPVFVMAAAKLLYFLHRGHRPLALRLAEDAFASSTAFATSFAVWGQMRMQQGDLEAAVRLFDRGLELCRGDLQFELYLRVMKCQAMLASGSREATDAACEAMYLRGPQTRVHLSLLFSSGKPGETSREAQALLDRLDKEQARGVAIFVNYVCARLFEREEHRANILRGLLKLFVERFGEDVVADEVRSSAPSLLPDRRQAVLA